MRYGQTKLANAAFSAALHERLRSTGSAVRALLAHPGFASTELQVNTHRAGGMAGWTSHFVKLTSQSAEDGALGLLSCASLPDAQSGLFYGPGSSVAALRGPARAFPFESQYDNPQTRALLWEKSCIATGEAFEMGTLTAR